MKAMSINVVEVQGGLNSYGTLMCELEMGLSKSPQTKGTDEWDLTGSKVNKQMLSYWSCIGAGC